MPRLSAAALSLVLLASLAAWGCGDDSSPTSPTGPDPVYTTDTYTGTLNAGETGTHPFTARTGGSITITLTALTPNTTMLMGIGLGTWNGMACNVTLATSAATQGSAFNASATVAGNYCITIYDIGNITEATNYTVTLTHP